MSDSNHHQDPSSLPFQILVVDDNDDHAALVQHGLNRTDFALQVNRVADGQAALSYLRGEPPYEARVQPSIILLDVNLPGKSGHEVLAEIRADKAYAPTTVIMLSTSSSDEDVDLAYRSHTNAYVVKPNDFEEMCKLMNDLVGFWGRRNQSPRIG